MKIESGTGNGKWAGVDVDNRLLVKSNSFPFQHANSISEGQAYQITGETTLASGTVTALHLRNTSISRNMVFTYIRHQVVGAAGGTAFPNASNYFRFVTGLNFSSGGASVSPINVNIGSGNLAEVTVHEDDPTLTGNADIIDKWYTQNDGDMSTFRKEGAVVVQPGQSVSFQYVGDHTSGLIYTRASFIMEEAA